MLSDATTQAYTDFSSFSKLRSDAKVDPKSTLHEVARQFESIYIQMMLKSMRSASLGDPIFDSHSSEVYRDMFDNQIALQMSEQRGIGLADMLVRQLQQNFPEKETDNAVSSIAPTTVKVAKVAVERLPARFDSQDEFVEKLWPMAEAAADELGTSPQVLLSQAALETGWGQHIQQLPNGKSSHNLFNIKADERWSGPKLTVSTVEYADGVAKRQKAAFRSYGSYEESFRDYVDFIKTNPRYQDALDNTHDPALFAHKLHEAGYATDPAYADKWLNIIGRGLVATPQTEFLADG